MVKQILPPGWMLLAETTILELTPAQQAASRMVKSYETASPAVSCGLGPFAST